MLFRFAGLVVLVCARTSFLSPLLTDVPSGWQCTWMGKNEVSPCFSMSNSLWELSGFIITFEITILG